MRKATELTLVKGFTLIELVVVMLIVGILATTMTLSLRPDHHRILADEAYRLARELEQACDAAQLGEPLVLVWQDDGYDFAHLTQAGQWQPVNDELLKRHHWPEHLQVDGLRINGQIPVGKLPHAIPLWQGGQATLIQVTLQLEEQKMRVELSPLGRATVEEIH